MLNKYSFNKSYIVVQQHDIIWSDIQMSSIPSSILYWENTYSLPNSLPHIYKHIHAHIPGKTYLGVNTKKFIQVIPWQFPSQVVSLVPFWLLHLCLSCAKMNENNISPFKLGFLNSKIHYYFDLSVYAIRKCRKT